MGIGSGALYVFEVDDGRDGEEVSVGEMEKNLGLGCHVLFWLRLLRGKSFVVGG